VKKRTKFFLLRACIIAIFAILAGRLWYVQVVMGSYYQKQGDNSKIRTLPVLADRGIIYDRNGTPLVFNQPTWSIAIVPHGVPAIRSAQIYSYLSQVLGGNPKPAQIASIVSQHAWQPYVAAVVKEKVSPETAMVIKQLHAYLPGVQAVLVSRRSYATSGQFSMSHIVGYTGAINAAELQAYRQQYAFERFGPNDDVGQMALEGSLDRYLHGVNGQQRVEVDAGERPVRVLTPGKTVAGDAVYLTIDSKLQQQVANDVASAIYSRPDFNWTQAIVVLEDVHSGAILSMVSLPSYDNNAFSQRKSKAVTAILTDPRQPLVDLATQGAYPPGSTYKVVTAAAALETGVADVNRLIDDTGQIKLGQTIYHGWNPSGLGPVNVVDAIAKSSDIYFYTVAGSSPQDPVKKYIGGDRLAAMARKFGIGSPTGIELPEAIGRAPTTAWHRSYYHAPWYIGDTYNSAIGQGDDLATPLQMANIAATIANGGIEYRPHVVEKIVGRVNPGHGVTNRPRIVRTSASTIIRRDFVSASNLALIQLGMRRSVTIPELQNGTSFNVADPRLDAAGKTGTSQVYGHAADAWWIGYAPYDAPKVAIAVLVPYADSEGAFAAAPIAQKVLQDYFHLKPLKANWLDDVTKQLPSATQ
jgi:penicillin-binding protein 2